MGPIVIFAAAAAAFAVGAALVLLYVVFRRSEQHRDALIQAYQRIDQLERSLSQGAPARVPAEPMAAEPPRRVEQPPGPPPHIEPDPPPLEPAPVALSEPAPLPEPDLPARFSGPPPSLQQEPPPPPAPPPLPPALEPAPPQPLRLEWIAGGAGLIAALASLAARSGSLPPIYGFIIAASVGIAITGFAEWRRGRGQTHGAAPLAAFGLLLITAGLVVARLSGNAAAPLPALIMAAALALCALVMAAWHGRWLIAFGLALAIAAPLLAPLDAISAHARHILLFAAAAASCALARARGEYIWAWIAIAGALAWGVVSVAVSNDLVTSASTALYLAALNGLFVTYAWPVAANSLLPLGDVRARDPLFAALAGLTASTILIAILLVRGDPIIAIVAATALVITALLASVGGVLRPGLAPAPLIVLALAAIALRYWPAPDAPATLIAAGALAATFIAAGAFMLWRGLDEGALLTCFAPLVLLVAAQAAAPHVLTDWAWPLAALALALATGIGALRGQRAAPLAAALSLMSAALALVAAIGFVTPAPWPPIVVAICLLGFAWADSQSDLRGLRTAVCVLAGFVLMQLIGAGLSGASEAMRVLIYLIDAVILFVASLLLAAPRSRAASESLLAATIASIAVACCIETYRFIAATPTPDLRLLLAGAPSLIWLGFAYVLAWRFAERANPVLRAGELAAFIAAAGCAIGGGLVLLAPWWGLTPASAPGWPGANLLLAAYLGPAILFFAYGRLRERQGLTTRAMAATLIAVGLALAHVTLELRRAFHPGAMAEGAIVDAESWAYTLAWLGFSAALVLASLERGLAWLRHVAAALALATLVKAAMFDARAVSGLAQFAMFALLAGAGVGVVLLYRQFVLPARASGPKTLADPPTG